MIGHVSEPTDPRLADYIGLTDADLRRVAEPEGGFFIAEGEQVVRRLLASDFSVRSVLVTPRRFERLRSILEGAAMPVYIADEKVLNQVVGFNLHRGAVASANRRSPLGVAGLSQSSTTIAVLEGINDQENLGAVFRSAAALGIDSILLDPTTGDPYYRRTVRVSMGAVLTVPFARFESWPGDIEILRAVGFTILALTPEGTSQDIRTVEPLGKRVALLLGAEGHGLRPETTARTDATVRIPMVPGVDSLNVGHAAAVAFHRFGRAGRAT